MNITFLMYNSSWCFIAICNDDAQSLGTPNSNLSHAFLAAV